MKEVVSDASTSLGSLFRHARTLAELDRLLTGFAEPGMAAMFQVANVRQQTLVLITPTAAWATRLRMNTPQMLDFLRQSGFDQLQTIEIRVAPLSRVKPRKRTRKKLSPAATETFEQYRQLTRKSRD